MKKLISVVCLLTSIASVLGIDLISVHEGRLTSSGSA